MKYLQFEWNQAKSKKNLLKHGISFEEARSVFYDENAQVICDSTHSDYEERFVILGLSNRLRLLVVCHSYRADNEIIRIISARKASRSESSTYGER